MTRYCKFHIHEGESQHWGVLDRKSFALKGAKPHFTPDTPFLPKHLKLDLNFDWKEERVWGTTTHQVIVKGHHLDCIEFDAVDLEISKVLIGTKSVPFDYDRNKVHIPLSRPPAPGKELIVKLVHAVSHPPAGIYFTQPDSYYPDNFKTVWTQGQDEDSKYYFPCFDKPNFKQSTEVILNLPAGMFGLSNGTLIEKQLTSKKSKYHYRMEVPYSTYLFSIVAGEFVETKDRWKNIQVKWYVQKGREREGKNAFKDTADMLRFFSEYTGYTYPYKHYTQIAVPDFVFGGMENFTVTTQTDLTLHDDRAALDGDSNCLVAHEAAHTWFGNLVTVKNWSHAWLHESFATYFDALYTRESKGEDEFRYQLLQDAETYFSEDLKYRRPIVTHIYKEPIDLFDAHLYPGGAVRLHHLKSIMGEEYFRQGLERFLKRHEFSVVETVDLMRSLEEISGRNFDGWLDQWIYRGGYPILELKYQWDAKNNMALVDVKQVQKAEKKEDSLLFHLNLKIAFYFGRSEERFPIEIQYKEERFCFKLKSRPKFLRLDPDYECPCKKVNLELSRNVLHEQLKVDPDPIGRIQAAKALQTKPSSEDIKILGRQLLKEGFWGVAERIAETLGKIGGNQSRDALLKATKLENPKTRRAVVQALGKFPNDSRVVNVLKKIAEGDSSYRVEASAFRALGRVRDLDSRQFLEDSFDRPTHNDMLPMAIFMALGDLELEDSWDTLVKGADYGAPKNSRSAAMKALAKLGARFPHRKEEAIECLTRLAQETRGQPATNFRGKLGAIHALTELDDLKAIPTLRWIAENETDGRLRRRAEEAVSSLFSSVKKPVAIQEIRSELEDLTSENKSLRQRIERIEKNNEANQTRKDKRKKK